MLLLCPGAGAGNLLLNPSFEELHESAPVSWHVFVAPMEGAYGRVDTETAADGDHSVKLYIPEPYESEPINNWSQNILADTAGKTLRVRGAIKTRDAVEAELWLQCCRKNPYTILQTNRTGADTPLYGTQDWTSVEMDVDVPKGTEFIVLRCVLKGRGAAWFDSMEVAPPDALTEQMAQETAEAPDAGDAPSSNTPKPLSPGAPATEPPPSPSNTERDVIIQTLRESHRAMVETNATLRDLNDALRAQVEALQQEVALLRAQQQQPQTPAINPAIPPRAAPPLVPRGYEWETTN
ncbi:MAG: hypothetical protein KJ052_03950 [Candidatus Hydrogenedentes bacterium]|nr:hypothetical protein [Candidatus Hydrogenedentota bacterium]